MNDALRNIDLRDLRCLKDIFRITHNISYQKCFKAPIYERIKKNKSEMEKHRYDQLLLRESTPCCSRFLNDSL